MNLLTRRFPAWSLALLLVAVAGCGSDDNPSAPITDTVPPEVSATNPANGATGVAVITATFNEPMTYSTITASNFTLSGPGSTPLAGTVSYDVSTRIATFTPTAALALGTAYVATVTTGVKDWSGNAMANNHVWSFSTSASASSSSAPDLGDAGAFAILAGSTVTSTGATSLTGDLGVSPGTAVTGFPPGTLSGTMHAGNSASAAGMTDLTTAYNDIAGQTLAPVTVAGNLGGLTLPPGLYKSTSSLSISSGNLTLDAQGDPNGVFLFQIASSLTTTSGRKVHLVGGAKASNVFWQVGSSATLGTTTEFKGTILANQSITLSTGAMLNGRALARIGAVTLAGNPVVVPTP